MLINELKKVIPNKCDFVNAGIILFSPLMQVFYKISFGDGSDDEPIDDCDEYLYITEDKYDGAGFFNEDVDGGNMWFHRKDYSGKINDEKLIRNALEFVGCPDIDNCIFVQQFV